MSRDRPQTGDLVQINDTWLYAGYVGVVTGVFYDAINVLFGGGLGHTQMPANRVRIISKGGSHDAQDQHR
jgi:hypothetical protein